MKIKSFKEALKKSIEMYDIISKMPNETDKEDYFRKRHIRHVPISECYLCASGAGACSDCKKFKVWAGGKIQDPDHVLCFQKNSIYSKWTQTRTPANAAKVRDALIAALKRVEKSKCQSD